MSSGHTSRGNVIFQPPAPISGLVVLVVIFGVCCCAEVSAEVSAAVAPRSRLPALPICTRGLSGAPALRLRGGSSAPLVNNFEEVGNAFVQHYYRIFDSNRGGLQNLYQDVSMLTFEGEKIMGATAISQKLVGLPFQTGGGVLVSACGNLKVDGSEHPMKFSQVFCLIPNQNGQGWFCYNDVFRLNYG